MEKSKKAKKTIGFLIRLCIVLAIIGSIGVSGYFIVDKVVIPSYFGKYDINGIGDLVALINLMHSTPDEKSFITHPYTSSHEQTAVAKLKDAGVPVNDGKINFDKIVEGDYIINPDAKNGLFVSDYEMAAILGQMLESGYLATYLEELSYFDTLSFTSKEVKMTPNGQMVEGENGALYSNSAEILLIVKLDTTNTQKHMAKEMDVPLFLLNLIMPDSMYLTCKYTVQINEENQYNVSDATLAINGKTPEQSQVLLNMLISFIFPKEDEMTISKLSEKFGDIVNSGLKVLGEVQFCTEKTGSGKQNGIFVSVNLDMD